MNPDIPMLDSTSCPLNGVCMIEAAAGTGKTYNIQNLVLRLILEQDIPISGILVVTFTEAATAELRTRIRDMLRNALNYAAGFRDTGKGTSTHQGDYGTCGTEYAWRNAGPTPPERFH